MTRAAGILLPITSLPSKYGIGCFSKSAYSFIDWLKKAGQTFWQILPLCPTGYGDSPYQSFSTFAGNPYFICLETLIEEGVLTEQECDAVSFGSNPADVNYEKIYQGRYPLLRKAYERSAICANENYQRFVQENSWWLNDYALFMALKNFFKGRCWYDWPEDIRLRWGYALDHYRRELYFDIEFQMYMQFKFFEQYRALKTYANINGIRIIGDIPIYVAMDSADTWANPQLFQLDEQNLPIAVSGCPPDGFAKDGQLWGNPLYRWQHHRANGYQWWLSRLWYCYQLYDLTRIDHFRGFDEYYAIPRGNKTAAGGWWEKGPGIELFRCAEQQLGWHEVIAEDLGYMTDGVRHLVHESGFPNMKVLEFAFDRRDTGSASEYLPHNYPVNSVVYTGTHDNETLAGWFDTIDKTELQMARDYFCARYVPKSTLHNTFICAAMRSVAKYCIIPIQDYLGLGNDCRTNKPSTVGSNWRWRLVDGQLNDELCKYIYTLTKMYGRLNWQNEDQNVIN